MKMHRTQICLTNPQYETLVQLASMYGLSLAEYIRRIVDKHIEEVRDKARREIDN
jgi:predicted DNA-binding protein